VKPGISGTTPQRAARAGRWCTPRWAVAIALILLSACTSVGPTTIDLMPAPGVYRNGAIDPFADTKPFDILPSASLPYATQRAPVAEGDREAFYRHERGAVVRLGVAKVELAQQDLSWEEARQISLAKSRDARYRLRVDNIDEFGVLDRSVTAFTPPQMIPDDPKLSESRFAETIDAKLEASVSKDIFVYVHGYKVNFENPVLVAAELWHFLGYDGVFVAFAWPSTPNSFAYFSDAETADWAARGFRLFLEYLAQETSVECIHVLAYSAGTRMVTHSLAQLALLNHGRDRKQTREQLRLGHVILVGSDVDRQLIGGYIVDGLLNVPERLTIYLSDTDTALDVSRWIFGRDRSGQRFGEDPSPQVAEFLWRSERISLIDVTDAEAAAAGNGHAYFRDSPWASSDILATLKYDLTPQQRGLVRSGASPVWMFPPDYLDRLSAALIDVSPALEGSFGRTQ
jgi:esterase/lipase superfamily enzyme